VDPHL